MKYLLAVPLMIAYALVSGVMVAMVFLDALRRGAQPCSDAILASEHTNQWLKDSLKEILT